MSRWRRIAMLWRIVVATAFAAAAAPAQEMPKGMDPAAAVSMLTDASANETGPAAPFMGLATKIMVDPLFGTATTTIPIELPPGRRGMTPDLTVRYSSNAGTGIFGLGWDLQLGCIKRDTSHGIPFDYANSALTYDDSKGFVLMFRGGTVVFDTPLAATGGCTSPWGASSEEVWLSACFKQPVNQCAITDKNGVVYTYGDANARTGIDTSAANKTFEWYLTHVEDPNGNAIDVSYVAPAPWHGHVYPVQVDYGANSVAGYAHKFRAVFDIGTPRPDSPRITAAASPTIWPSASRRLRSRSTALPHRLGSIPSGAHRTMARHSVTPDPRCGPLARMAS